MKRFLHDVVKQGPARTRFAPSPTGELHLGGLRSALFNWLLARSTGGTFILRIEDTDQKRLVPGAADRLVRDLWWAGLGPDEGYGALPKHILQSDIGQHEVYRRLGEKKAVFGRFEEKSLAMEALEWLKARDGGRDSFEIGIGGGGDREEAGEVGAFGPYVQSMRREFYGQVADGLLDSGHAYRCFCSAERLDEVRKSQTRRGLPPKYDGACASLSASEVSERLSRGESSVVRMRLPTDVGDKVNVFDEIVGSVVFPMSYLDDGVLLKSDGLPTYHLASVCDDRAMRISHVVRGQEWLPSAPRHVLLHDAVEKSMASFSEDVKRALEVEQRPKFVHLPLLLAEDGKKLSKRHGDQSVAYFREQGYIPEGLVNFVATLGWSPPENASDVLDISDLISMFSLDRVQPSNAVVSLPRLNFCNAQHLRKLQASNNDLFSHRVLPHAITHINSLGIKFPNPILSHPLPTSNSDAKYTLESIESTFFRKIIATQASRITTLNDIGPLVADIVLPPSSLNPSKLDPHILSEVLHALESIPDHTTDFGVQAFQALKSTASSIKNDNTPKKQALSKVILPVRYAITGTETGGSLAQILDILGKEVTIERLQAALKI